MFLECVGTEIRSPMIWSKFILNLEETPQNPDQPDSYGHNYSLPLGLSMDKGKTLGATGLQEYEHEMFEK